MFENRRWLVIPTSLTSSIDFNQVLELSADTLRHTEYNHANILALLSTEAWTSPMEEV